MKLPDHPPGQLGTKPYSDTITLSSFNLDPGHFDFSDTSDLLFAVVHIGNIACNNATCIGQGGEDSIWVGSRDGAQVPEPASLLLVGSDLLGLGLIGRKLKARC